MTYRPCALLKTKKNTVTQKLAKTNTPHRRTASAGMRLREKATSAFMNSAAVTAVNRSVPISARNAAFLRLIAAVSTLSMAHRNLTKCGKTQAVAARDAQLLPPLLASAFQVNSIQQAQRSSSKSSPRAERCINFE